MTTKKRERRLIGVSFTPEFLGIFLKKGKIEVIETPFPDDAEYLSTHYDFERDIFVTVFYHPSFEIVKDGMCIPRIEPNSIKYKRIK